MATVNNQSSTNEPQADVSLGTACRYLASKGQYITGQLFPTRESCGVGDGYCWCNQTQEQFGPDDQYVGREYCISGRACFVPLMT